MPSTTFRIFSSLTIVLLLAALVGAILWTVQTRPATVALPAPRATLTTAPAATSAAAVRAVPVFPPRSATAAPYPAPATAAPTLALPTPAVTPRSAVTPRATRPPLLLAPTPTPVFDQSTSWRAETDARDINAAAVVAETVWLATEGGALAWRADANMPLKYTSLDGLPGNRLTTVVDCPLPGLGVVFGGDAGLAIFDAESGGWRQMNPENSDMRFTDVAALACDLANERLLIGYAAHGIDIYLAGSDAWRRLDRSSGLGANDVRALAVDNMRNAIWVASSQGVTRAAGQDSAFYAIGTPPLNLSQVNAITVAPSGMVWLGGNGAVYRVNGETWTRFAADTTSDGRFLNEAIVGMTVAADGSVWLVDTAGAVCRLSAIQNRCVEFYPATTASPIAGLPLNGDQLSTLLNDGGSALKAELWRTLTATQQLEGNRVRALAADADGMLWVATESGLQRFLDQGSRAPLVRRPAPYLALANAQVLQSRPGGGMWVGGRGASVFDGDAWKTYTVRDGLAGDQVQAIATDGLGRTWLGTDQGLSIWNGAGFFNITAAQGLPAADIRALEPVDDAMWIGSWGGGLYRFVDNQLEVFNVENTGLPSDLIAALAVLPDGDLLLGTARGLARFADGAVTPVTAITAPVTAIALVDGVAWVATEGAGVFVQQGDGWSRATLADGLPAATITAIAATADAVWLGGETGGLVAVER